MTSGCKKPIIFPAALNKKVSHCRAVAKKYKRAKNVVNWSALAPVFSSASFGSALSVVGLPATIPLGGAGGAFALASSVLIIASLRVTVPSPRGKTRGRERLRKADTNRVM